MNAKPRVAVATLRDREPYVLDDDPVFVEALNGAGAAGELVNWDDPHDWSGFDAVVIRSPWDYFDKRAAFRDWVDHVDTVSLLLNPARIVHINDDKMYLRDLRERGIPIVPTEFIDPASPRAARDVAAEHGWVKIAIKSALGGGASGLLVTEPTDEAERHLVALLAAGPVLIQPFLESIYDTGEVSVVLIGGEYSHAVRKTPTGGDHRVQIEYGGRYELAEPSEAAIDVALRTFACFPEGALYARIDMLEPDSDPKVIEAELVEPELFFRMLPESADRMARLTLDRIAASTR
ncbi:MAG: hypothetical protein AAFQ71_00620 [Planctomycetota bacterium]